MRQHILTTTRLIAENPHATEAELVDCLCCLGYDTLHAELLIGFVPLGLARAVIGRMQSEISIALSHHVFVMQGDRQLEIPLELVPEFVEALRLGQETFTTGAIPREEFSQAVQFSVELKLVSDLLNDGGTSATLAAPILLRLGDTTGFEEWYREIKNVSA